MRTSSQPSNLPTGQVTKDSFGAGSLKPACRTGSGEPPRKIQAHYFLRIHTPTGAGVCVAVFVVILFHFVSCKKETVTPIDFSKYTVTDSNCLFIGAIDNTDWTYDTVWTATESSLMYFSDNISLTDSVTGYITISPPCPNPNDGLFIIGINTERECKMKIACVNTEMETLYFTAKKFTGGPIVTAYDFRALTSFHKNMNYRMYYAFYTSKNSLYYKGHGDFRIE